MRTVALLFCLAGIAPSGAAAAQGSPDPVPQEFREVEAAVRSFLREMGTPPSRVRFVYEHAGSGPGTRLGRHHGNTIYTNLDKYPASLAAPFHEAFHQVQQDGEGRARFERSYGRFSYESNPYEAEARRVGERLHEIYRQQKASLFYRPETFARAARVELHRLLPTLKREWKSLPPTPEVPLRFQRLDVLLASKAVEDARLRRANVRSTLVESGNFLLASLAKSSIDAAIQRDPALFGERLSELASVRGGGSVLLFSAVAGVTRRAVERNPIARTVLPLVVATGVVDAVNGRPDFRKSSVSALSTLAASSALHVVLDKGLFGVLLRRNPPANVLYNVTHLVGTMYAAEGLASLAGERPTPRNRTP